MSLSEMMEQDEQVMDQSFRLHVAPQETPHGIPRELLEEILSYVTEPRDISRVEGVNTLFRDIAWNSFTTLDLDGISGAQKGIERLKTWFPVMWRKSENLKGISWLGDFSPSSNDNHSDSEFLLMLKNLNYEMPRQMESLCFDGQPGLAMCPVFPSLLEEWVGSLKKLETSWRFDSTPAGSPERCSFQMTVMALRKCRYLRSFKISEYDADFSEIFKSLKNKEDLKEMNIVAFNGDHRNAVGSGLLRCLTSVASLPNRVQNKFRLSISLTDFEWMIRFLSHSPISLTLVTELNAILFAANFDGQCTSLFQCLPRLHFFSGIIMSFRLDSFTQITSVMISSFLHAYANGNSDGRAVRLTLTVRIYQADEGQVMRGVKGLVLRIRNEMGIIGEMVTDFSDLGDPTFQWSDEMLLIEKMTVKFVSGQAEVIIKFE